MTVCSILGLLIRDCMSQSRTKENRPYMLQSRTRENRQFARQSSPAICLQLFRSFRSCILNRVDSRVIL